MAAPISHLPETTFFLTLPNKLPFLRRVRSYYHHILSFRSGFQPDLQVSQQLQHTKRVLEATNSSLSQQLRLSINQLGQREQDLQGARRELAQSQEALQVEQRDCQDVKEQLQACQSDREKTKETLRKVRADEGPWHSNLLSFNKVTQTEAIRSQPGPFGE
ncbi:B-cell differentiation antigen CD72 [Pteropus alecto]|uniref:B-cell differentiation antigen CD72 n=1 Tax=Pteropus alecto TaxID=9402 RepID=L5KCG8_PTEAL|nr:B-cell differentiation antigen CD72 [Pteropus alecto]